MDPIERQQKLAAAFDEECEPYQVGGLMVRPFSLNAHRRAEQLGLAVVALGVGKAKKKLSHRRFCYEMDLLAWLLTAPLPEVRRQCRLNRVESMTEQGSLPGLTLSDLAPFTAEMARVLDLAQAAMFDTEPRDLGGKSNEEEPEDLLSPGQQATTVLAIADKLKATEDWICEWLPFCRLLQYTHVIQSGSPHVWTIDRHGTAPEEDPHGEEVEQDEGFGEEVAF
jgi:hypothetical protein